MAPGRITLFVGGGGGAAQWKLCCGPAPFPVSIRRLVYPPLPSPRRTLLRAYAPLAVWLACGVVNPAAPLGEGAACCLHFKGARGSGVIKLPLIKSNLG